MATPLIVQTTDFNLRVLNAADHPEGILLVPPGVEVAFHNPDPWKPTDDVPAPAPPSQCGSTEPHPAHGCAGLSAEDIAPRLYMGDRAVVMVADLPDTGVLVLPGHEPASPDITASASGCAYGCP